MRANRLRTSLTLAAVVSLLAAPSGATVYFENQGDTSGWTRNWAEHNGSVAQVGSPTYRGSTALRMRQVFDGSYRGRYHSEVGKHGSKKLGWDRYYGWTFYLPSTWTPAVSGDSFTISQFITNVDTATEGCGPTIPTTMTYIDGTGLRTRVKTGGNCGSSITSWNIVNGAPTTGVWHRLVLRGKWASDATGAFQAWYDGSLRVNAANIATMPTIVNKAEEWEWRVGLYAGGWYQKTSISGPSTRDIYHDHVRIASSYAEADPGGWGGGGTATPTPAPTPTPGGGTISGYYRLTPRHSGKAVAVQSASTANSANVLQWTYGGSNTNDEWEARSIGSGYYRLIARHSGKDMVVASASTADGGNVVQYAYGGTTTNDEWAIVSVGSGYYRITSRHSGKSIEVAGGSTADGANVNQRTYSGATHQQFQMVSVP